MLHEVFYYTDKFWVRDILKYNLCVWEDPVSANGKNISKNNESKQAFLLTHGLKSYLMSFIRKLHFTLAPPICPLNRISGEDLRFFYSFGEASSIIIIIKPLEPTKKCSEFQTLSGREGQKAPFSGFVL